MFEVRGLGSDRVTYEFCEREVADRREKKEVVQNLSVADEGESGWRSWMQA